MLILVDQDGPLAYFELGFLQNWRTLYPDKFYVPLDERRTFYPREEYPKELRDAVESIYFAPGFYRNLPPVPGGIEALQTLVSLGHDVRICTSPLSRYENCILEKYQWVEKHLGRDFTKRIILSKDKTVVRGQFLIDDNPKVEGAENAEWEHVLFDCPYNRNITRRRLNWSNYREVLGV